MDLKRYRDQERPKTGRVEAFIDILKSIPGDQMEIQVSLTEACGSRKRIQIFGEDSD